MTNPTSVSADLRDTELEARDGAADGKRSTRSSSTGDAVFEVILRGIVTGVHAPGTRLPAERELARTLGASRPTLREALRRLTEWRLIEPRRGSGIVVRPASEWSIDVLPAYLRYGGKAGTDSSVARLLSDLLVLRRTMIIEIIGLAAGRIGPGDLQDARSTLAEAWALRYRPERFPVADYAVLRSVVQAAECYPALWLLNRLAGVYFEVARPLARSIAPPDDYLVAHETLFDALEEGDRGRAVTTVKDYLERHDRALMAAVTALDPGARARPEERPPAGDVPAPLGPNAAGDFLLGHRDGEGTIG
ncbi:MAG: GntR family transcriptional regulator [Proteobacteria bacterium]|nr:GntR family transcriptional regulator [Pseudomonadota bacterium]